MTKKAIQEMFGKEKKGSASPPPVDVDDFGEELVPVGLDGILLSTEKLLAINRGEDTPDQRDSYAFKRVWGVDRHVSERVRLDAGKTRLKMLRRVARDRSLKSLPHMPFNEYGTGLLLGDEDANPLASSPEQINPMHIADQARRMTQKGPGGILSDSAITTEAQAVDPSQFGFVSPLEGPESGLSGIDVRLASGVRVGSDGRLYQQFRNARTGQVEWKTPSDLASAVVSFGD